MAIELVCACGRLVRFDKPPVDGQGRCPDCNAVITIENDRSIMATLTDMPVSDEAPESTSAAPPGTARKPLWEMMARNQNQPEFGEAPADLLGEPPVEPPGAMTVEADYDSVPAPPANAPAGPAAARKGLWSVMQTPAAKDPGADTPGSPGRNPKSDTVVPGSVATPTSPPDSIASLIGIAADEGLLSARTKSAGLQAANSRRAVTAAVLGGLSIPLSGLALINADWTKFPATVLGFVALLMGLIASQEIRRSGGRKTGRRQAITGIATGVIGVFLGPVVALLARSRKGR